MKSTVSAGLLGLLSLVCCVGGAAEPAGGITYIPLQFRTISGVRPFIDVEMGGKKFLMKVHSGAELTMMTIHAHAQAAGVTGMKHVGSYGISKPGEVSQLGMDAGVLPEMTVAGKTLRNLPISVFEIPQDPPVDGMLGSKWLKALRAIVDYDKLRFGLPATPEDNVLEDQKLLGEGYIAHRFTFNDANGSYQIDGEIDGVKTPMTLVTVAENVVDIELAREAGIPLGPVFDTYAGPGGAVGDAYLAKRMVRLVVDGQTVVSDRPQIYDTYAYHGEPRKAARDNAHSVRLGADFLLANQAVIDFGTNTLFLRPLSVTDPAAAGK
ncbi:hypothetical protein FHW58_000835 [Duganella sp. 1224]|uniref:aspartyl protease family protein n=1 Tax=Duganella sp. 1224 TaxID=2587052 RepID=UPI0015C80E88|nr:aspartyl protease family protein [Duganella sp. 1224]NYE59683.1 hypothetical protein [Duganella sp. 1224]